MTINELADYIDVNRDSDNEYLEIVDNNGTITRIAISSEILTAIGDWKVRGIDAVDEGIIRVWITDDLDK